jgi:hypothetical protein
MFERDALACLHKITPLVFMKNTLISGIIAACACVVVFPLQSAGQGVPAAVSAPAGADEVEVSSVKYGSVRAGRDEWIEADVEIEAKPGGRLGGGMFLNRVRVTLSVAIDVPGDKGGKPRTFYRSSAEALALEAGKSHFRFYFPPEIVKRDKLRASVDYFAAEVELGGKIQAQTKASFSAAFTSAASLQKFLAQASSESTPNEGMLIPQFLTPFAADPQRPAPTFLRKEAQR